MELTIDLFKKLIINANGVDHNAMLVSPLGNLFLIGESSDIEEFVIDDHNTEFTIIDAFDTKRKILFNHGRSDYGILIGENGTPSVTTGIGDVEGDDDWAEFVSLEIGEIG